MKHRLVRGVAALGILFAPLVAGLGTPAGAVLPVPGIIDVAVEVESLPAIVAPPGSGVVYRITVSSAAISLGGGAIVTGTLPTGFDWIDGDDQCSEDGGDVMCEIEAILPGSSVELDIQVETSLIADEYDFTVNVESTDVTEPLEYQDNNTDTTTTDVREDDDGDAVAFVCGGCTLEFSDPTVGTASLFVQEGEPGVFARLEADDEFDGGDCGPEADPDAYECEIALGVVFVESDEEPDYQSLDPTKPVEVTYAPVQAPCHGVGSGNCAPIGYYDPSKMTRPLPMEKCDGAGSGDQPGDGEAFVNGQYQICKDQTVKVGNQVAHVVLMKSTDPLIPPLSVPRVG